MQLFAAGLVLIGAGGLLLSILTHFNAAIWLGSGVVWFLGLIAYSFADSVRVRGARRTVLFFLIVAVLSIGAEYIGIRFGILFGSYEYNPGLVGPMLDGRVPIGLALAWWVVLYLAFSLTDRVLGIFPGRRGQRRLIHAIALDALAATILDLTVDPACVHFYKLWSWNTVDVTAYQGIPFTNFISWFLVVALISFIARQSVWAAPRAMKAPSNAAQGLYLVPVILLLLFELKMATVLGLTGRWDGALVGTLAILPPVLIAFTRRMIPE